MIRFVFDTNTIVSALLFGNSVPRQAFDRALDSWTILISDSLVAGRGSTGMSRLKNATSSLCP